MFKRLIYGFLAILVVVAGGGIGYYLIGGAGYGLAFGAVALFPLVAAAVIPVGAEGRALRPGAAPSPG